MADKQIAVIKDTLEKGGDLMVSVEKLQSIWKQEKTFHNVECVVQNLILLLPKTTEQPKIARKLVKIVSEIEVDHADIVSKHILEQLDVSKSSLKHYQLISVWSQLLECSACSRDLLSNKIESFLKIISEELKELVSWDKVWTTDIQEKLQAYVKVCLQLSQHLSDSIKNIVWNKKESTNNKSIEYLQTQLVCLLSILDVEVIFKDTRRLAATVFGYVLMLCEEQLCRIECFVMLLQGYKDGSDISMGELLLPYSKNKNLTDLRKTDYGEISLINGFICCCSTQLFLYGPVIDFGTDRQKSTPTTAEWLFKHIHSHCTGNIHLFHAFKTLLQWYQKLQKSQTHEKLEATSFRYVTEQTLSLVWTNLDSPIDGVTESVMEIFRSLIDIMVTYGEDFEELLSHVIGHVMQISWQVKGKYTLCAVLLSHIDVEKFLERYNDTWSQLLVCMSTNYLSTPATEVYRAITTALVKDSADKWKSVSLSWLIAGLTNSDSLTCYHVCHLWLPWTLKTVSSSYQWLLQELTQNTKNGCKNQPNIVENGLDQNPPHTGNGDGIYSNTNTSYKLKRRTEQDLRAHISVCMAARKLQIITLQDVPESVLLEGLLHSSDDVRLDAFALVLTSPKKSECISQLEMNLLQLSLPHAMTSDTPPFRQQLQSHVRAVIVRIRDGVMSCTRELKQKSSPRKKGSPKADHKVRTEGEIKEHIEQQLDLLDWLWVLCVNSIQPCACFQRLKTSLEWVWVILDSIVFMPDRKRRKGGCPDSCSGFLSYAESLGKGRLFTYATTQALLACVMHGADEIRELSCNILLEFFPHPFKLVPDLTPTKQEPAKSAEGCECYNDQSIRSVCDLLYKGLMLCRQPRAHDANSGALVCRLIYQRYVLESGWLFKNVEDKITAEIPKEKVTYVPSTVAFLSILVSDLENCVKVANDDMLKAAQKTPTHGTLVAIQYCIEDTLNKLAISTWRPLMERIVTVSQKLVGIALDVLGGKLQPEGSAPSFEQMSLSIQTVIEESIGDGFQQDAILSEEHQLLMTWAWLNIRETSILYGRLTSLPIATTNDSIGVLTVSEIRLMGDVIVNILTRCRHRGAIEGSNLGLIQYCGHLLHSENPELHDIPRELVDRVIEQVLEAEATSVTRRSAGLPLIVQAVLASETKTKQTVILTFTINKLLSIIEMPLPSTTDQRLDLPHVHAFNILKVLFAEASIATSTVQYIERACMLAIQGFSSPVWAVRNSATQLFSTLQNRILGQKRTKDDSLHTTTIEELFSHFPALKPFLLTHLQGAAQQHASGGLHPSLFPVLAILSKLSPGVSGTENDSELSSYLEAVQSLASSPMYAVRELSSHSLVPLVSPGNMDQFLLELALDIPVSRENCTSFNRLHGKLMQIKSLLQSIQNRQEEGNVYDHIRDVLTERAWLCGDENPCYIVKALYLHLMDLLRWEGSFINSLATQLIEGNMNQKIGSWQLTKVVFSQCLDTDLLCELVEKCLSCKSADIQLVCVQRVRQKVSKGEIQKQQAKELQISLLNFVREDLTWELLCETLHCITDLHNVNPGLEIESSSRKWEVVLMQIILKRGNSEPAALALSVFSILFKPCTKVSASVTDWVNIIHKYSDPSENEAKRIQAAESLQTAGVIVLNLLLDTDHRTTNNEMMALRLIEASVQLLMDEQSEVRKATAGFVCQLPWIPGDCIYGDCHPSYCLGLLFKYVLSELSGSPMCVGELFRWIEPKQPANVVIDNHMSGYGDLFEAQAVNPYSEIHVLCSHITAFIWNHKTDLCSSFGNKEIPSVIKELQNCVTSLQKHSKGVLGLTCQFSVYQSLLCLLYRIHALLTVMDNKSKECVQTQLQLLQKVSSLHSGLKKLCDLSESLCSY